MEWISYLRRYHRAAYTNFIRGGRLHSYPAEIDIQAQGAMERPKKENALEWAGRRHNIRACAREMRKRRSSSHRQQAAGRTLRRFSAGTEGTDFVQGCRCLTKSRSLNIIFVI